MADGDISHDRQSSHLQCELTKIWGFTQRDNTDRLTLIMSRLFQPLMVGDQRVEHRIAMAPLTRYRAEDDRNVNALMKGCTALRLDGVRECIADRPA